MYMICKLGKPQWLHGNPRILCYMKDIGDEWMLKNGCHAFSEYAGWYPRYPNSISLENPFTHFSLDYCYFNWTEDS